MSTQQNLAGGVLCLFSLFNPKVIEGWINSLVLGDMELYSELLAWSFGTKPLGP